MKISPRTVLLQKEVDQLHSDFVFVGIVPQGIDDDGPNMRQVMQKSSSSLTNRFFRSCEVKSSDDTSSRSPKLALSGQILHLQRYVVGIGKRR